MRVAITGGSGFIGTNLMLWLQEKEPDTELVIVDVVAPVGKVGPKTSYVYADVRDYVSLERAFAGCEEVYHLAGILGTSELIPITALASSVNVVGVANVLDACVARGVKRVYNVAKPHFDGFSENAYTLTKHSGELLGLMYRDKFGLEVATVRWLNAVGPYQHLYPVRKLVPTLTLFALHGIDLEVYGSGEQTIDPIDARDMAEFTVYACRNLGKRAEGVELGSGIAVTCNDAVQQILEAVSQRVSTKSKIVHLPMRPGEVEGVKLVADMSYWDSVGMKPRFSFAESIESVVDYVMSTPLTHRKNALRFYGKEAA